MVVNVARPKEEGAPRKNFDNRRNDFRNNNNRSYGSFDRKNNRDDSSY